MRVKQDKGCYLAWLSPKLSFDNHQLGIVMLVIVMPRNYWNHWALMWRTQTLNVFSLLAGPRAALSWVTMLIDVCHSCPQYSHPHEPVHNMVLLISPPQYRHSHRSSFAQLLRLARKRGQFSVDVILLPSSRTIDSLSFLLRSGFRCDQESIRWKGLVYLPSPSLGDTSFPWGLSPERPCL